LCETLGLGQFATMLLATIDLTYAAIAFAAAGAGVLLVGADAPRRSGERRTAGSARLRRDARYRRLHRQRMPRRTRVDGRRNRRGIGGSISTAAFVIRQKMILRLYASGADVKSPSTDAGKPHHRGRCGWGW
jgi:hypothetical protein